MVFSSLTFVCLFLPTVLFFYFIAPRSARNLVLVVASAVFYAWGGPIALVLIGISIAANFAIGKSIDTSGPIQRRCLIIGAVTGNLLILILFKYANFIIDNVNLVLNSIWEWKLPNPPIPMPLGISFFTFHIISYLVDVYRGVAQAQRSPVAFTLYIINFPQLIAGPIIRYRPISDQLEHRSVSFQDFDIGIARFAAGLAKKLLIANPIGAVADQLLGTAPLDMPIWAVWLGVVCYGLQIYFDFSGYSDMAIGMGRMFGFRFPENFNYPYAATSMQDFWRRWHMSLSFWFRDYVYKPLGGSRAGDWTTVRNLWIVFLLVGAWHGAAWNFIVWGMWHGLFLSIERLGVVQRILLQAPLILRNVYVLFIAFVGWVFFRSPTLELAADTLSRMFGLQEGAATMLPVSSQVPVPMVLLIIVAACFAFPIWPHAKSLATRLANKPAEAIVYDVARATYIAVIMVISLASATVDQQNPFIYFRF
jgi:alginate O-acetyltransferase complex protein AlgI